MHCRSFVLISCFLGSFTIGVVSTQAQSTTWNNTATGTAAWGTSGNWNSGVPNSSTDAIFSGTFGAATTVTNSLVAFRNASADVVGSLSLQWADAASGGGGIFNSESGTLTLRAQSQASSSSLAFSGQLLLSAETAGNTVLQLSAPTTLSATGGILLGADGSGKSSISYYGTGNSLTTINANITFNNGSNFTEPNEVSTSSVLAINGNVTVQAGAYTGAAASIIFGRPSNTSNGAKVTISGALSTTAGSVTVRKGRTLEAASVNIGSGSSFVLAGFTGATGSATLRTAGSLIINGGTFNSNSASGADGTGFLVDVGGDFHLGTGSAMVLASATSTNGQTTMELAGNFDISAISLSSGNLNNLRLKLDGTGKQTLEAAVTDVTGTFSINTLTLTNNGSYELVDAYTNIASGEYFKTLNLVNEGNATLNLNGLRFFVGNTELTAGSYTSYGGLLTIVAVPEPGAFALVALGVGFILIARRRKLRF